MSSSGHSNYSSLRKEMTSKEKIVSRNLASGNSLQINGDAVDQIWNFQVENMFINYRIKPATDAPSSRLNSACSPESAPEKATVSSSRKKYEKASKLSPATDLRLQTIPAQSVVLYPRLSDTREVVRAIFRPSILENFITRRIVRRLKLEIDGRSPTAKTLIWGETDVPPITTFVDLACSAEKSSERVMCRFYVARRCPFDVLFGSESMRFIIHGVG
ncbi:hypothetical protein J1614_003367 [Plenodomus biglobosus]|nr:hypothetical protein J1614_003367 [Plenodomus biglobosus]